MKIAFYIDNKTIENIDCSNIYNGNPGIGGTEYMFFLLTYYLSKKIEIILLTSKLQKLPYNINNIQVENIYGAIAYCKKHFIDIFIIRTINDMKIYSEIARNKVKTVLWSHNFITNSKILKEIYANKYIRANVFVSKEQLLYYIDDNIYKKSLYIYNLFDTDRYKENIVEAEAKNKIVTYIGSLTKEKGFHIIAKQWKKIIKDIPEAELHVIGGGNLYDRNAKLGSLKLTSEKYEKMFIKYITDKDNKLLPSVVFHGILGEEKKYIIKQTKVGISNPSGKTETFGLTALEFQASGVPVVTKKCVGYLETVNNKKSGYLINNGYNLRKKICDLLNDNELNNNFSKQGINFARNKFDIYKTLDEWLNLFNLILNNEKYPECKITNIFFGFKFLKVIYGKIRNGNSFANKLYSYSYLKLYVKEIIKNIIKLTKEYFIK
ncbi:hypothetical protein UT300005_14970 [Clostridium sp. CTA-5]